ILNFKKAFPHVRLDSYTVITRRNVRQLYKTACYLHKFFGVQEAFFSFLISPAERENFKRLAVSFNDARPCLQRALDYLSGHNLPFRIDKCPKCVFPQYHELHHYEKGVFDPDDYCKHAVCESCPLSADCPGFSKQYVAVFGFDGLRLGGFQQDELKYFFAGLNMGALKSVKRSLTFDEFNNPVLNFEREEGGWEQICKDVNIPLCAIKSTGKLIDIWNDFQFTPEFVEKALRQNRTVSCEDLSRAVCQQLRKDFKAKVSEENVLLTAGSRPALYAAFLAHIRPGDLAVLKEGMWDGYRYGLDQTGGRVVEVSSYDELENVGSDELRLVIVNNPQLPSVRQRLSEKEIRKLISFCNQRGTFLLVDEIGNRLSPDPFSVLSHCDMSKDRVIVTQSFSKNYFIPQYKAGYAVAHPEIISKIKRIIDFSGYPIAPRSVQAAHAVLCSPQQWQKEKAAMIYKKGTW
ncbi:MAG TPA: pyridoxal phosphate-dependent aminotransferase, partial [Candidatus Omnitrophota bacterium]|nr:pyridoxal phosphate-dependent aminotransferase [Candidatus Omnitrophota bacterium]